MGVMTIPDVWSGQDRMLTVGDMVNMPDDEFRDGYEETAHVTGEPPSWSARPS